jgi:ABC-type Fe3+ transport system permease subunit
MAASTVAKSNIGWSKTCQGEEPMEEKNILNENGITVTNTRFIVPSQTYAMAGITSVKNFKESPKRSYPIGCGIVGLLFLGGAPIVGIVLIVLAVVWWIGQKSTYHVVLTTAGGEVKALSNQSEEFISKVIHALNEAIVARG